MNVNIERALKAQNEAEEKEQFGQLLDVVAKFGGYDPETFEAEKEAILNSGISLEDFTTILGDNIIDKFGPVEMVNLDIQKLTPSAKIPTYAHETDACADIYADETVTIEPGQTAMISTGIALAIPVGFVVHIYPRSSIGAKTMLRLSNSVGVVDSGYRDEIKVVYTNTGDEPYTINEGDRIAQMSIDHAPKARFHTVSDVKEIGEDREGGFGSTGV